MSSAFVPRSGDIVWLTLDNKKGHEQSGRRPFLVLSSERFNAATSLLAGCPITSRAKGFPFEVPLNASEVKGVVLAHQVQVVDWRARRAAPAGIADAAAQHRTRMLVAALIGVKTAS